MISGRLMLTPDAADTALMEDSIMRMSLFCVGLVAVTSSIGCASKPTPSVGPTMLQGTAALSSYPSTPRTVVATDESGRASRTAIAPDGSFTLALRRAHTYRVDVITDKGTVPMVFPRTSGKVTTTFALKSDGARLSLGAVRYVLRTQPLTLKTRVTKTTTLAIRSESGKSEDNCENCGSDDQDVSCEDGSHGRGEGSDAMERGNNEAGGAGEASIAERNVPESVDGCGVDENDDDHQNEGEETGQH